MAFVGVSRGKRARDAVSVRWRYRPRFLPVSARRARLAPGLRASARSADGMVEAAEVPGDGAAHVVVRVLYGPDESRKRKGVRLADLINKAVPVTHDHNDVKKMIVVATATDGYRVVFSWSEIFNSPAGEGMIVYFEKDGQPLGEDEGHIAMVSTKDTKTGPRPVATRQKPDALDRGRCS